MEHIGTKRLNVLVACEFSGIVRDAFAALGHNAWSCDLLPTEAPGQHVQGDVMDLLDREWDLLIAHPTCTYLTNAGVRHLHDRVSSRNGKRAACFGSDRWVKLFAAAEFFNAFKNVDHIPHIAIENPIPHKYAKALIGDYTQIFQPWHHGHGERKAICLWLKNLPPLSASNIVEGRVARVHLMSPGPDRAKDRSLFFPGVARAMASQWTAAICVPS